MKKSFKRLIIDSSTKFLYVSLYSDLQCLGKYYQSGYNDHSVNIMGEIESIFKSNNIKVSQLDEIIVGIGPGSYTGLRIGVVVAKMFGWNNNIPVRTVSSLALIASSYGGDKLILAEMDARRGNSFLGLYGIKNEKLSLFDEEKLTNLEEYKSSIKDEFDVVSFGEPNIPLIIRSEIALLCDNIHSLNPNYLRLTEAERNLK
ncbi:MAG: tRNA (adenosine(37)-N6)-threonylcarbamoyltransferase complex dimerization subunit type 1 TsaB [Firmicutes bacterium]|nr:tRNA (adenosine(37)-N6)-threonylcarbamoyltransferase complex dimerization subunit type 1 TsaB [Bacillota bacterium]